VAGKGGKSFLSSEGRNYLFLSRGRMSPFSGREEGFSEEKRGYSEKVRY